MQNSASQGPFDRHASPERAIEIPKPSLTELLRERLIFASAPVNVIELP